MLAKKRLRKGFTTGTYAAACARAGAAYLSRNIGIGKSQIVLLPGGEKASVGIKSVKKGNNMVQVSAIKDAGDDPDITDGIEIFVRVSKTSKPGINIIAGKGIGKVTLPGLQVTEGEPAINPVPKKMIHDNVAPFTGDKCGYDIEISIPRGAELAKKTFNPRLGIEGGLSILGTTGYVIPRSVDALKKTIDLSMDVAVIQGYRSLVFVPGNIGERLCREHFGIESVRIIQISNYIGSSLEYAAERKIKRVLIGGHIGKLVKIAAGLKNTSSYVADLRLETIAGLLDEEGEIELARDILVNCRTAEEASEIIRGEKLMKIFNAMALKVSLNAAEMSGGSIWIRCAIFNYKGELLGTDLENGDIECWL